MGPAIRKAISTALSGMVQNFNQTLTHSMSAQGLSWRWEALRTGRSFSEVVLVRTLLFRVEQVFLIHKETGLLLCQVSAPNAAMQDADMVSGMLTAIQDFVGDSYHPKRRRAGNVTSRRIKCLDRTGTAGNSRASFGRCSTAAEGSVSRDTGSIHLQYGTALQKFSGDASTFAGAVPLLEKCLQSGYDLDKQRSKLASLVH